MVGARGGFTFRAGVDLLPAGQLEADGGDLREYDTVVEASFSAPKLDLDVPKRLSLASFDDAPISTLVGSPLTSISRPSYLGTGALTHHIRSSR